MWHVWAEENSYRILVWKPVRKRPPERTRGRREDNT
jgi:hypothetical protein